MNLCDVCIRENNFHINHIHIFSKNKNLYSKVIFIADFIKKQKEIILNSTKDDDN